MLHFMFSLRLKLEKSNISCCLKTWKRLVLIDWILMCFNIGGVVVYWWNIIMIHTGQFGLYVHETPDFSHGKKSQYGFRILQYVMWKLKKNRHCMLFVAIIDQQGSRTKIDQGVHTKNVSFKIYRLNSKHFFCLYFLSLMSHFHGTGHQYVKFTTITFVFCSKNTI